MNNIDWTRVLGSAVLLGGAIAAKMYTDIPNEAVLALFALVPALWVVPPLVKALGKVKFTD